MPAARQIVQIALVVRDYDEAIEYYTRVLGFALLEDEDRGGGKRWVRMAPTPDGGGIGLLLAKAVGDEQASRIGNQTGGRVFLFLHTDNFAADHARLVANGVTFLRGPIDEPYGRVAVFADLYGNKWDLIEPSPKSAPPSW
jgi:catechol 2,3-dioxygenase-like lactoylglutathione lyase family enzyme